MLKIIFYVIAAYLLWSKGLWGYAVLAYIAWEFSKATQNGGVSGGVQTVALKSIFALMLCLAVASPVVTGTWALLLGLAGAIGMMVKRFPTFGLREQIREGMAADQARDAADASRNAQRSLENQIKAVFNDPKRSAEEKAASSLDAIHHHSTKTDPQALERVQSADANLASVRDAMSKERAPIQRQLGGQQQSFLNWFINGSNGHSNGKQSLVSWFLFGSKGAPTNDKQSALGWFSKGANPRRQGGGLVSHFLFGTPVKKKPKRN